MASTINPGSAIEIKKPRINPAAITIHSLFVLARVDPITLPRGVTPMSTPIKKKDNPKIIKNAPIRNLMISGASRGVSVTLNINTMIVIGRIENITSFSFSVNIFK